MTKHPLFLLVGPSGAGKTSVVKRLLELGLVPSLHELVSTSTRAPRPGESHGKPYYFVERDEFDAALAMDEFVQWVAFGGNRYGTTHAEVEYKLARGPAIAIVEAKGPANFKKALSPLGVPVHTFYLDVDVLVSILRMRDRGDELDAVVARLWADSSIRAFKDEADHVVDAHWPLAEVVVAIGKIMNSLVWYEGAAA